MDFLSFQIDKLQHAGVSLISPASIFSAPQLAAAGMLAFVFLALRQKRRRGSVRLAAVFRALCARRIATHRSTRADLFYYLVNTFAIGGLIGWGLFSAETVSRFALGALRAHFGTSTPVSAPDWLLRLGLTCVAFLAYELGYYVDHYLKHKVPILWAFHKTHHSAEVLTPLTVFRVHPIDSLIFVDILALTIGLAQALFSYAIGKDVPIYSVEATNAITVGFLFVLAHLQHSQIWIPLRGFWGCVFLSPAHHQIHHSIDPAHYNRNLGSFLAIFDWAFGTLAIPQSAPPQLTFGVAQDDEDPHRVQTLMIEPIASAARIFRSKLAVARPRRHLAQS